MDSVLMVCSANICRSPLAAVLWRERASYGRVASAGIDARPGLPADPVYLDWVASRGLGLESHRSVRFHAGLALRFDLILVMEEQHRLRICTAFPALRGRVQLLGRWTCGGIADPHRRSRDEYYRCLSAIEESIEAWQVRWPARAMPTPMAGREVAWATA
jgi:protein-tyrosine phosphatase